MKKTKKELSIGIAMLASFACIFVILFSPVINGEKPIDYLDNLYNSISKGSVYYIPKLLSEAKKVEGGRIEFAMDYTTQQQAEEMTKVFSSAGARVTEREQALVVSADLHRLIVQSITDADALFHNRGEALAETYGFSGKRAVYYWWLGLKAVEKKLTREKRFEESLYVNSVISRAVECSFNYFGIEPKDISAEISLVVFSLVFYVLYTLWFGFAIMYIFIGLGLRLEH